MLKFNKCTDIDGNMQNIYLNTSYVKVQLKQNKEDKEESKI